MELWLIYLIASAFAFWTIGIVLIAKGSKKRVLAVFGALAILLVATPSIIMWQIDVAHDRALEKEQITIQAKFDDTFGKGMLLYDGLDHMAEPQKIEAYLITRYAVDSSGQIDTNAGIKQAMLVGDKWLPIQTASVEGE